MYNLKIIKNIVFIVSIILCIFLSIVIINKNKENNRLKGDVYAVYDSVVYYKAKSGKLVSRSKELTLTLDELNDVNNEYTKRIDLLLKDIDIKKRKIKGLSTTVTEVYVKDSIILHDTIINEKLRYKTGTFTDPWTKLTLKLNNDTIGFELYTNDTIDIVTTKEKIGKFRFINLFKKRPEVLTHNATMTRPNSKVYINSIKIKE